MRCSDVYVVDVQHLFVKVFNSEWDFCIRHGGPVASQRRGHLIGAHPLTSQSPTSPRTLSPNNQPRPPPCVLTPPESSEACLVKTDRWVALEAGAAALMVIVWSATDTHTSEDSDESINRHPSARGYSAGREILSAACHYQAGVEEKGERRVFYLQRSCFLLAIDMTAPQLKENHLDRLLVAGCSIGHKPCLLHVSRGDVGLHNLILFTPVC